MKKKIFLIALLVVLTNSLVACGRQDNVQTTKTNTTTNGKTSTNATVTVKNNENNKSTEDNKLNEDTAQKEDSQTKTQTEKEDNTSLKVDNTTAINKEVLENLMQNSDYISRVRVISTDKGTEPSFIEDYKGDLSNVSITLPKSLAPSKEYVFFYKDGKDGKIEPTNGEASFMEIGSDNDASLNYIETTYSKDTRPNVKNQKNDNEVKEITN